MDFQDLLWKVFTRMSVSKAVGEIVFSAAFICWSVFSCDIWKADAPKVTKFDIEMFWSPGNPSILGSKGQTSRSWGRKKEIVLIFIRNRILPLASLSPLQCPTMQTIRHRIFPASFLRSWCCCWPLVLPCIVFFTVSLSFFLFLSSLRGDVAIYTEAQFSQSASGKKYCCGSCNSCECWFLLVVRCVVRVSVMM